MTSEILMNYDAYRKIFAYAYAAKKQNDSEVGGFLQIEELEKGGLLVEDIILPEQTASGGSFTVENGVWMKKLKPEQIPKLKGWWHSHHNMGTFHSGTDDTTLGDKWDSESKNGCPYGVSIVVAFPNKMLCYLQYYKPIKTKPFEVEISIIDPPASELEKACEEEVKEKVKKFVYQNKWPYGKGAYEDGDTPFLAATGTATDQKIVEELGGALSKKKSDVIRKIVKQVFDPLTGFNVEQLVEQGLWDPILYPDLVEELEDLLDTEIDEWNEETGFADDKSPKEQLKEGECSRLARNEKDRLICFIKGKNYNCKSCTFKPVFAKEKQLTQQPAPTS